jgi:hypothetical protein
MHTRRLAAFFCGAWILGTILMMFIADQNLREADRIMTSPPAPIAKELDELGRDITQQLLRYQASEANREMFDIWGIIQVGLAAALLSSTALTAHRSKLLIAMTAAMMVLAVIQAWYIVPALKSLGRAIDFLPLAANTAERESFRSYHTWYGVLDVFKILLGVVVAGRLLFDRYGWQGRLLSDASTGRHRRRRRRKRTSDGSEVQAIDHPHDGHVDG